MKTTKQFCIAICALSIAGCTMNVTSTADRIDIDPGDGQCADSFGQCTLRAAIMEVNESNGLWRIAVPAGQYVLDSAINDGAGLTIKRSMRIQGAGVSDTVINGNNRSRVFLIQSAEDVEIQSLSILAGNAASGAGMLVDQSDVDLHGVRFRGNSAANEGGGMSVTDGSDVIGRDLEFDSNKVRGEAGGDAGGAAYNAGGMILLQSLFVNNEGGRAGGIHNDEGAIMFLDNVTVSGNRGRSSSGSVGGILSAGSASIVSTTVTDNEGSGLSGAGGLLLSGTGLPSTSSGNSLYANNFRRNGNSLIRSDCKGDFEAGSYFNLVQAGDNCDTPQGPSTWILGVDARLLPLADNGGPTRTHALREDSPAIDTGFVFGPDRVEVDICFLTDQRGIPRPQTLFSETSSGICDIGAYEAGNLPSFISSFTLVDASLNSDIGPLRHGDVLNMSELPDELSVRANLTQPSLTDSVTFDYDNDLAIRTENLAPYSIAGDGSGNYAPFDFGPTGEYEIVATPYSGADGTGSGGGSKSITVTVVRSN